MCCYTLINQSIFQKFRTIWKHVLLFGGVFWNLLLTSVFWQQASTGFNLSMWAKAIYRFSRNYTVFTCSSSPFVYSWGPNDQSETLAKCCLHLYVLCRWVLLCHMCTLVRELTDVAPFNSCWRPTEQSREPLWEQPDCFLRWLQLSLILNGLHCQIQHLIQRLDKDVWFYSCKQCEVKMDFLEISIKFYSK